MRRRAASITHGEDTDTDTETLLKKFKQQTCKKV